MCRVGYMGIPFSNTEAMAKELCAQEGIVDYELVPLMSAVHVIDALVKGEADLGVLAVENAFAGPVMESVDAVRGHDVLVMRSGWCHIRHSVFTKSADSKVRRLVSHIQALLQSQDNLKRLYPDAEWVECEDTAYAAEMLADGTLDDDCAAVCRRDAGEHYGLYLRDEDVQDNPENMTRFELIRLG